MKGFLYGPIQTNEPIKLININLYDADEFPQGNTINNQNFGISNNLINVANSGQFSFDSSVSAQPGLTIDGKPTDLLANSIPYSQIQFDDDWGIITAINQIEKS